MRLKKSRLSLETAATAFLLPDSLLITVSFQSEKSFKMTLSENELRTFQGCTKCILQKSIRVRVRGLLF